MLQYTSWSRKVFTITNYVFFGILSLLCLFPFLHVLAISFSSNTMASAGVIKLWPVDFTTKAYEFVLSKPEFIRALGVTIQRVIIGLIINMVLTVLIAYPLSKDTKVFRWRTLYAWFFVFTMLFGGGLIPWYVVVSKTGLIDSIWALIIPGAVPVFYVILLLNFFRQLPKELEEAASIDGASHIDTLLKIYIPISLPALATITLFTMVAHWNSWFDGLILMNRPENYPLQSYLQTVIITRSLTSFTLQDAEYMSEVSDRTSKAAQIFLAALPIFMVYPFLQKYFIKGIVLGSVKE